MVAQRQYRVRKPREKREGREERQKPEEEGSKESQESMLLKREDFIVSCAQQTLFAVVVRRTIGVLRNGSSEQSYNAPLAAYHNSQPLTTTLRRFSPKTAFGRQISTTPMRFHAICGTMTPCGQTSTFSTPEDNSEASKDNIVISTLQCHGDYILARVTHSQYSGTHSRPCCILSRRDAHIVF